MANHPRLMLFSTHRSWALSAAVAGLAFLAATLVPVQARTETVPPLTIEATTDGISVEFRASTSRELLTFSVRVVGPERFRYEEKLQASSLEWVPRANLPDGFYHWEAWVVTADPGAPTRELTPLLKARAADHWYDKEYKQTHLTTGSFRVEGRLIEAHHPPGEEPDARVSLPQRIAGALLDFLVPAAHAAEEGSSNNFFGIGAGANDDGNSRNSFFGGSAGNSTTTGDYNSIYGYLAGTDNTTGEFNSFFGAVAGLNNTEGYDNAFFGYTAGLNNTTGYSNAFFGTQAGLNNTTAFYNSFFGAAAGLSNTEGLLNTFIGTGAGVDNTTGDANTFLGEYAGRNNSGGDSNISIGSSAGLSNTTENLNSFVGASSDGVAGIFNATALGGRAKVTQSNSLVLGSIDGVNFAFDDTDVGIGVSAPDTSLHVRRMDGSAQVLVEDTGGSSPLQMFTLDNNGFPRFTLQDSSTGEAWDFRLAAGKFTITRVGTGGPEFEVFNNGDAELRGTLTEGSSREIKDHVVEVDHESMLAKLDSLPISEWSYIGDNADRHVGPMAEDFHAAFGLGPDNKHIAPKDLAGVALAAAKALKAENEQLKARLDRLEALIEQR